MCLMMKMELSFEPHGLHNRKEVNNKRLGVAHKVNQSKRKV